MSLIALKSDYIYYANNIYTNLREFEDIFEQEAQVISYAKYTLLRNEELDDFNINGIYVYVYQTSNGYELCFNGYSLDIDIYNKQIIDFEFGR